MRVNERTQTITRGNFDSLFPFLLDVIVDLHTRNKPALRVKAALRSKWRRVVLLERRLAQQTHLIDDVHQYLEIVPQLHIRPPQTDLILASLDLGASLLDDLARLKRARQRPPSLTPHHVRRLISAVEAARNSIATYVSRLPVEESATRC